MLPESISVLLADEITAQQIDLLRFDASLRRKVIGHLFLLEEDLESKIRRYDIEGVKRDAFKRLRAEKLIEDTRSTINSAYRQTGTTIKGELRDIASFQLPDTVERLNSVFRANIVTATLTPTETRLLADDTLIRGAPLKDWWQNQSRRTQEAFASEMRLGIQQGETNDQLVRRVRGTSTGRMTTVEVAGRRRRVRQFTGGIMRTSTRNAETMVRTATQSVSNRVLEETYRQNQDVIKGETWVSTLDAFTCTICIALDGAAWDLDGNPLPESPYQGPKVVIPAHPACRCALGPLTYSWDEMIERAGGRKRGVLNTVPDSVRSSIDGTVPGATTFDAFLRRKGEAFARKSLGAGRYELWQKGRITTSQLIDQSARPLTIAQLRKLRGPSRTPPRKPPG